MLLTKNSSLIKYFALITSGSSPGSINASPERPKGRHKVLSFRELRSVSLTWRLVSIELGKVV